MMNQPHINLVYARLYQMPTLELPDDCCLDGNIAFITSVGSAIFPNTNHK